MHWGRYDVEGHRTIYVASLEETAYAESIAAQRVNEGISTLSIGDLFSEADPTDALKSAIDAVTKEWDERHHMRPRQIAAAWRAERLKYDLLLPRSGWFVDIEHAETVSVLNVAMANRLVSMNKDRLTVADLKGEDRELTTAAAAWVHAQVLDDGSLPHGILYESKHAKDRCCWAVWLRAIDDGKDISSEPTTSNDGTAILPTQQNAALETVSRLFNVTIH